MLGALLADAKQAAAQTEAKLADGLRRAVIAALGGILVAIGLGFLTTALWILLAREWTTLVAATVIAAIYLVVGLICLMMARGRRRVPPPAPIAAAAAAPPPGSVPPGAPPYGSPFTPRASVVPPLVEAFFFGLNSARASHGPTVRRRRRRRVDPEDDW